MPTQPRQGAVCQRCGDKRAAAIHKACADHKRWRSAAFQYVRAAQAHPETPWKGPNPKDCTHKTQEHHDYLSVAGRASEERIKARIREIWLEVSNY